MANRSRGSGEKNPRSPRIAPNPGGEAPEDRPRTPSQAEGERDLIEQDLSEKFRAGQYARAGRAGHRVETEGGTQTDMDVLHTPSQAEGDRETIERDLEQKLGKS